MNNNEKLYMIHDDNVPKVKENELTEEQRREYEELKRKYGIK